MPTISALGIGSGLDLNGLLDQLNAAEREKLVPIVRKKKSFEAKISAYGQLRSSMASFQSAAKKLEKATLFEQTGSSVSGTALTAAAGPGAKPASYNISVTQLARAYSVATAGVADREADLGAGTVTVTMANGDAFSVSVDAESSSLEAIRDAINKQDAGVNAAIVNDGSGTPYRLSLTSAESGEDAAIASIDFGALASSLALDPLTEVGARNAKFTANGIEIVSQTNQVEGAIEGVTLSLAEEGDATLTVSVDNGAIEKAVTDFVSAYNKLQGKIDELTVYDQETGVAGDLLGDSTLRSANSRLRAVFVDGLDSGSLQRLSDVGISLQLDGKLEIDNDRLSELVSGENQALSDFFAGADEGDGLADKLVDALDAILNETGLLKTATNGLKSRVEAQDDRYDRVQLSIERTVERYRRQFAELDGLVANMNSTSSYIAQQFSALNAQLGRSS